MDKNKALAKFNPQEIEKYAALGMSITQVCNLIGVSTSAWYNHTKDHSFIREAYDRGRDKGVAQIANKLFQSAMNGNTTAQMFYLKCKGKWSDQSRVEGQGAGREEKDISPDEVKLIKQEFESLL